MNKNNTPIKREFELLAKRYKEREDLYIKKIIR